MNLTHLIAAIAVSFATAASAGPAPGTATLAAPALHPKVVGDAGSWRCDGTTCTGTADTSTRVAVATCTLVANANGRVTAFAAGPTAFGEAELARCNRHVKQ